MANKTKPKTIVVTFKKTEEQLYTDIMKECEIIKQADWMKIAAKEKLERDNSNFKLPKSQLTNCTNGFINKPVTSAEELFP